MAWLPGRMSTLAAFGQTAGAARAHNLRLEKAVLRVRCVRADLSEAVILEQANKLAQSGRESVFDVLDDFARRGAMGVPLPFEATKEGANSMKVHEFKMPARSGKTTMALALFQGFLAAGQGPYFWVPTEEAKCALLQAHAWVPESSVLTGVRIAGKPGRVFIVDDADKGKNTPEGDVVKLLAQRAQTFPDGVVYAFSTIEEGANSMNEAKQGERVVAEVEAAHRTARLVRDLAVVASNRLELGDRPQLVLAELRASVDSALSPAEDATPEDQITVHMTVEPMGYIVSNEELRAAICDTVQQMKPGPLGSAVPKELQERLQIHLDRLLKVESMRACFLVAGADVTDKPVEG